MTGQWNGTALVRVVVAPVMLGLLAACSDGGGGADNSPPPPGFSDLLNESLTLTGEISDLENTPVEDLPTSGQASYEGVMLIETADENALAGEMEMTVDFADNTDPFSGQVSNVVDMNDERYAGTLDISNSFIDPEANPELGPTAGADLSGTLTDSSDQVYAVDADLDIGFAGTADNDASHAGGIVDGAVCSGDECMGFDGAFVLSR